MAKGDIYLQAKKQFGTSIPPVVVSRKLPYATKAPPVEADVEIGYHVERGVYVTEHDTIIAAHTCRVRRKVEYRSPWTVVLCMRYTSRPCVYVCT